MNCHFNNYPKLYSAIVVCITKLLQKITCFTHLGSTQVLPYDQRK